MNNNEFSENMVVCAVGNLSPGNISDSCESCPHNKFSFPGVLIDGVTKDAAMLLSEKVEIVPEGTKARMEEMAAANGKMRSQIEGLQKNVLEFFDSTNATVAAGEKISIDYAHLKNRVSELEASNKELLDVLEDFVIDIECYFGFSETDDMQPEDDITYFIREYRKAKSLIKKGKGGQYRGTSPLKSECLMEIYTIASEEDEKRRNEK